MPILALPTELLDQIFGYLDWDRSQDLYPVKNDIVNGSVTCQQLRKVLEPLVFRDVVLKLCWAGGRLIEPSLLKLRKHCPELARYIRCVYIRTDFHYWAMPQSDNTAWIPYQPPLKIEDWLDPAAEARHEQNDWLPTYRDHANKAARKLSEAFQISPQHTNLDEMSAERIIQAMVPRAGERDHEKVLALSIVIRCIPHTTETLIFKALTDGDVTGSKPRFALCVAATAMDLLRDQLQSVTMIANDQLRSLGLSWRQQQQEATGGIYGTEYISAEFLGNLNIQRLALASGDGPRNSAIWRLQGFERWQSASQSLRELDLRFITAASSELVSFIRSFPSLELLRLKDVVLTGAVTPRQIGAAQTNPDVERRVWLRFLIDVRLVQSQAELELRRLYRESTRSGLVPSCEVNWLLQAVPAGYVIDADREERLIQDYMSFLPLWAAENSERGSSAMQEWTQKRAELSDSAMSRRWV